MNPQILGYGEDALTLWAVSTGRKALLRELGEESSASHVFFRPSFGRRGGPKRAEFGEFDFIIVGKQAVYLGESKCDGCGFGHRGRDKLRPEQQLRHQVFRAYLQAWYSSGSGADWERFSSTCLRTLRSMGISKPVAPATSLLAQNLRMVLDVIRGKFERMPEVQNLLVYFFRDDRSRLPLNAPNGFRLISFDWSKTAHQNFVRFGW